jgi:hypothetical protein
MGLESEGLRSTPKQIAGLEKARTTNKNRARVRENIGIIVMLGYAKENVS